MKPSQRIFIAARFALATALLPLASGCNADRAGARANFEYEHGNFAGAESTLKKVAKKTDENYVLNNDRLGSVSLVDYDLDTAETAFLRASEVINSTGVNDGGRALSAAIIGENQKIWKGEPFERAMVNYYLGLLYYMQKDYNNSRAAFENSLFKLRDYSDAGDTKQYNDVDSDFVLAYLMLGKCYQHLHRDEQATAMFAKVGQLRPDLAPVAQGLSQSHPNLTLVIDWGQGPLKVTTVDHAFAGFGPKPDEAGPVPMPEPIIDEQPAQVLAPPYPVIDLLALAQDRRWQDIDTIRAVKSVAGKALMGVGAFEALHGSGFTGHRTNGNDLAIGAALIVGGALLDASSQADLRQWEMLPRSVFIVPMHAEPGTHDVTVLFPDGERQTWHGLSVPPDGDEATYYFRMLPNAPTDRRWPPRTLANDSEQNAPQSALGAATP